MTETVDAVVIGGGHNGLVAAVDLAEAGWDVVVLEASDTVGGAVRTADDITPGFATDLFSAFYPLTAASPVMRRMRLEDHGLRWSHAPTVLGHPRQDGPALLLHRSASRTAQGLDRDHVGDGKAWNELSDDWDTWGRGMVDTLLSPFPPVRASLRLGWAARTKLYELARMTVLSARDMASERFGGPGPGMLLAGNALHADITPEAPLSAMLGWMLCGLGQTVGFPVPVGGAGRITDALQNRLIRAGATVHCGDAVERIELAAGRAAAVHGASGVFRARRAVIAACDAEILYRRLLRDEDLSPKFVAGWRRFHRASGTVKVNWALNAPVPWRDPDLAGAGTVHIADSLDELTMTSAELITGGLPAKPFLLVGQMSVADPSRSPAGTESLWAYTHIPQDLVGDAAGEIDVSGRLRGDALDRFVERMEDRIEAHAPGFRSRVIKRHVQGPDDLEALNPSLIGGDIGGGTSQMHQQLIFRPVPGLARPETPIAGLFLGSASAHPGGAVHGACGANAARAALLHDRARRFRQAVSERLTQRQGPATS